MRLHPLISANTSIAWVFVFLMFVPRHSLALGQEQYVEEVSSRGCFPIVQENTAATICVDSNDYPGVVRVANDLKTDITRVTGISPVLLKDIKDSGNHVIV